jgi:hypothetical protein
MTDPLFASIEAAFRQQGWHCEPVSGRLVVEAGFDAHHTRLKVHVQAFPEISAITVVGYSGSVVPAPRAGIVVEMLMRLNQQLTVGNFEMNYDSGQVLFRATNIFGGGEASPDVIAALVHTTVAEIDRLTPFLTLLLRMEPDEIARLNLKLFLEREDLLPPVAPREHLAS